MVIWLAAASLGFSGGLAAYRAGLRGRRVVLGVVAGLVVGGAVLLLQVILQPGKAVSDGVAATPGGGAAGAGGHPARVSPLSSFDSL